MRICCVDTHLLKWGVRKEAASDQAHLIERAQSVIEHWSKSNTRVIIPAVVASEFLVGCLPEELPRFQRLLQQRFLIAPFDMGCVLKAAELRRETLYRPKDERPHPRCVITPDCQIVATALAWNADGILSHDEGVHKIAKGRLPVWDMDQIVPQLRLPGMDLEDEEKRNDD